MAEAEARTRLLERALGRVGRRRRAMRTRASRRCRARGVRAWTRSQWRRRRWGCRRRRRPRPAAAAAGTFKGTAERRALTNAMVNDPKYGIYFKMIKMGVPEQAVRNKMALDGVDAASWTRAGVRAGCLSKNRVKNVVLKAQG